MIIFISILVVVLAVFAWSFSKRLDKCSKYDFQSWEKADLPYITIDVQGHPLNMVTDSAAAISIIRREVLSNLEYEQSTRKINLAALTDESLHSEVVTIPIHVNGKEIKTDFVVYDGDDIADFRRQGITMDGILGVEFFKVAKGIVDFNTQTVKFP